MNARRILLATAAASLFLAGPALAADDKTETIKCEGVNACKGQSACKSAGSSCAGKNACKGKGFLMVTKEECEELKADGKEDKG
jgi:hypothetical protein